MYRVATREAINCHFIQNASQFNKQVLNLIKAKVQCKSWP